MDIKIGSSKYNIQDNEEILRKDNLMGQILYEEKTIDLQTGYAKESRKQTLLHEILHGMLREIGEDELNQNEKFVDLLSKQIYILINENSIEDILEQL